jgi:hypothetical protein
MNILTHIYIYMYTTVPYGFARQAREHESLLGTYI